MLEIKDLTVRYGAVTALHGVSLSVKAGEIVTLLGANGAGKTTTLRAISGLQRAVSGTVSFEGCDITRMPPHEIVRRGLGHVPEGRMIFANLTVVENLLMGAYLLGEAQAAEQRERVFQTFPRLQERQAQVAGTLSGGEQQMLAIGRALMGRPKCLLLDEPSLGIAPLLVRAIFEKIVEINHTQGITILLVEQTANLALAVAHRGCVLETGRVVLSDDSAALRANPQVKSAYLGG